MSKAIGLAALAVVTAISSGAWAEPETHDGFYLRLHIGPGFNTMESDSSPKAKIDGTGGAFGISLGGMVTENYGVFAEISDSVATEPQLTIGNQTFEAKDNVRVAVIGLGVGVIYWYMPINIYVSAALVLDELIVRDGDEKVFETDKGVGLSIMVGKEWWVSENWGLGVAAALRQSSRMDEKDGDATWEADSLNVVFSATYN
jgi:hypothetical protein